MMQADNVNPNHCVSARKDDLGRSFGKHLFREERTCERCGANRRDVNHFRARAKSDRVDIDGKIHFALIKRADFDVRTGAKIDALAAAKKLLETGFWPLWDNTPGRIIVGVGDRVCVYLSGMSKVVATASISKIETWSRAHQSKYPLDLVEHRRWCCV